MPRPDRSPLVFGPSGLPAKAQYPNGETKPFWDGTAEGKLVLPRCNECGFVIWYPRTRCPECHSTDVSWFEASGNGVVYSATVTRKGQGAYRDVGPFVPAYVELEEGPRVMTNIVGCDPDSVSIGMAVVACFEDTGEGHALVRFTPAP